MSLEIKVPTVGESITEVTLSQWLKQDGDYVEMDENIAELESDKATFELPAEKAGILKIIAQEGDTLEIGAVVATIEEGGAPAGVKPAESEKTKAESPAAAETKNAAPAATPAADDEAEDSYAAGTPSPAAAKILKEKGIDAASIKGSGKDGRITKEDALNAQQAKTPAKQKERQPPKLKANRHLPWFPAAGTNAAKSFPLSGKPLPNAWFPLKMKRPC